MPKISIIIPIYNVEKYIIQALDSVVNQTLTDIEIICVNDCTPDRSFEIVKDYALNDSRFVLIEQKTNQGQGVARNCALEIAKGDYIMFLDPDDWYELDACEKAYNQISKYQNEIVFFNFYNYIEKTSERIIGERLKGFENIKDNHHIDLAEIKTTWLTTCWTWVQIYSRKFLLENNVKFFDQRFAEDLPFFIRAVVFTKNASILDEAIYNYRRKDTSMTFDYTNCYKDVLSAKEEAYRIICESENKEAFLKQFLPYRIKSDIYWLIKFSRSNRKIKKSFFKEIKIIFENIKNKTPQNILSKYNNYEEFLLITKCNSWEEFKIRRFFKRLFK